MTVYIPPPPSRKNLSIGAWKCVGITTPCTWLYQANMGPMYLGLDAQGVEGWFGQGQIQRAALLWSWNDGFEHWLGMDTTRSATSPPRRLMSPSGGTYGSAAWPVAATPIAAAISDSNQAKRGTDIARAISSEESGVRTAVDIAHAIGGVVLTAFGGGSAVPALGKLEQSALDSGYGKR